MASESITTLEQYLATHPSESDLRSWMAQLPPDQYIECALHLVRQGPTTFIRVFSLEHAFKNPDRLSNEELFVQLGRALGDSTVLVDGKTAPVNPKDDPEPVSRFASLYNEAVRRGFQRDDIGFGMRSNVPRCSRLDQCGDPEWKRFEKLVARIHIALCRDAEVKWSEKLVDASGTERQIDVTIRTLVGPHEVLGVVQCKFEKRPVSISEVESFISVKKDLNAGIAIMVSGAGYQSGAEAKGRLHDIRLWTLEEAEHAAWRDEMRVFHLRYPMFSEVLFSPAIPADALPWREANIDFKAVLIVQGSQQTTLLDVLGKMIHNATERCLPIPFWMDVSFPGATLSLLGRNFPLERVEIHFTRHVDIKQQKQMKVPIGSSYSFMQNTGEGLHIVERDLPPLKPE
jgi:Restriction endonuclease